MEKTTWPWQPSTESGKYLSVLTQKKWTILEGLISPNLSELLLETQSSSFALALNQLGVLNSSQKQECINIREGFTMNRFLYEIILKKRNSVNQFIVALEMSGNDKIIKTLVGHVPSSHYDTTQVKDPFYTIEDNCSKTIQDQELKCLQITEFPDFKKSHKKNVNKYTKHKQKIKKIFLWGVPILTFLTISLTLIIAFKFINPAWAKKQEGNEIIHNTTTVENKNVTHIIKVKMANLPDYTYSVDYANPIIVRLQINSVQSVLPTSLVSISKYLPIHLKITTTVNYDWQQWSPSRPQQIEILTLKGCFNKAGIHHFLNKFTNLTTLNLSNSHSPCLCEAFTDPEHLEQETVHEYVEHLSITGMAESKSKSEDCDLLYSFLTMQIYFPALTHALIENALVTPQISPFLDVFFIAHKLSLERITLRNMRLVKGCELFGGEEIFFPYLDKASLDFTSSCWDSPNAGRTITNFSKASRLLSEFSSNVSCDSVDVNTLKSYWTHLRYYRSTLCQNV